jgi:hypothetical protein
MKDEALWRPACGDNKCPCAVPGCEPCSQFADPGTTGLVMPRCARCGWPEVSHVPEPERSAVRHPWHVEHVLRVAIADPSVEVRRLQDNLRGEPRFTVVAPTTRAVELACKVPTHLDRYVSIELATPMPHIGKP